MRAHQASIRAVSSVSAPGAVRAVLGAFFLLAAVSKTLEPWTTEAALSFIFSSLGVKALSVHWLVAALAGLEASVAAALFAAPLSRALIAGVMTLLGVFTGVLVWFALDSDAPSCGCFSALARLRSAQSEAVFGIARNSALAWAAFYVYKSIPPPAQTPIAVRPQNRRDSSGAGAFSLPELLVCICIVGILLALALPPLSRARDTARSADSLSLSRQIVTVLDSYCSDWKDTYPYFQTPGDPYGPIRVRDRDLYGIAGYFIAGTAWYPNLLVDAYLEPGLAPRLWTKNPSTFNDEQGLPSDFYVTRFFLTHTVFAAPEYWRSPNPPADPSLLRAIARHEVAFPSQKGLTLDILSGMFSPSRARSPYGLDQNVAAADGSARVLLYDSAPDKVILRPHGALPRQVLSTRNGVRGRDFD